MGLTAWGSDRVLDVPAGAQLSVLATGLTRKLRITESTVKADGVSANVPTGMDVTEPDDNFVQVFRILPPTAAQSGAEPNMFERGDDSIVHGPYGPALGSAGGNPIIGAAATTTASTLCKVAATGGGATSVRVQQWY